VVESVFALAWIGGLEPTDPTDPTDQQRLAALRAMPTPHHDPEGGADAPAVHPRVYATPVHGGSVRRRASGSCPGAKRIWTRGAMDGRFASAVAGIPTYFRSTLGGLNQAFTSLRVGSAQGLYSINLGTGAATLLGAIGMDSLRGLAIATVPEPGSLALVAVAGLAFMTQRRRRGAVARLEAIL